MSNVLNESWNVNETRRNLYTEAYNKLDAMDALQTYEDPLAFNTSRFVLSVDWLISWVVSAEVARIKTAIAKLDSYRTNKYLGNWFNECKKEGLFHVYPTILNSREGNNAIILDKGKYLRWYDNTFQVMSSFTEDGVVYSPVHPVSSVLELFRKDDTSARYMCVAANVISCILGSCPNLNEWLLHDSGRVMINTFVHDTLGMQHIMPNFITKYHVESITDYLPCIPIESHAVRLVDDNNTFAIVCFSKDTQKISVIIRKTNGGVQLSTLSLPSSILSSSKPYEAVLCILHAMLCLCDISANYISMFPQGAFSKDIRLSYGNIRNGFDKYRDLVDYVQDLYYR